jgi:hypothetical protein
MSSDDTTDDALNKDQDHTSQSTRQCSLTQIFLYLTAWALLFAAWKSDFIRAINDVEVFLYLAPGPLAGGAIGFIVGGRKSIIYGMCLGFLGWTIAGILIVDSVSL